MALPQPAAMPGGHDITLVCEDGRRLSCHIRVLASVSPRLAAVFQEGDYTGKTLPLHGVNSDALELVTSSLYSGRCEVTASNVASVWDCASKLAIQQLADQCIAFMRTLLVPGSCCALLHNGLTQKITSIVDVCKDFIGSRLADVVHTGDFLSQPFSTAVEILVFAASKQPAISVLQAAATWLAQEASRVQQHKSTLVEALGVPKDALALVDKLIGDAMRGDVTPHVDQTQQQQQQQQQHIQQQVKQDVGAVAVPDALKRASQQAGQLMNATGADSIPAAQHLQQQHAMVAAAQPSSAMMLAAGPAMPHFGAPGSNGMVSCGPMQMVSINGLPSNFPVAGAQSMMPTWVQMMPNGQLQPVLQQNMLQQQQQQLLQQALAMQTAGLPMQLPQGMQLPAGLGMNGLALQQGLITAPGQAMMPGLPFMPAMFQQQQQQNAPAAAWPLAAPMAHPAAAMPAPLPQGLQGLQVNGLGIVPGSGQAGLPLALQQLAQLTNQPLTQQQASAPVSAPADVTQYAAVAAVPEVKVEPFSPTGEPAAAAAADGMQQVQRLLQAAQQLEAEQEERQASSSTHKAEDEETPNSASMQGASVATDADAPSGGASGSVKRRPDGSAAAVGSTASGDPGLARSSSPAVGSSQGLAAADVLPDPSTKRRKASSSTFGPSDGDAPLAAAGNTDVQTRVTTSNLALPGCEGLGLGLTEMNALATLLAAAAPAAEPRHTMVRTISAPSHTTLSAPVQSAAPAQPQAVPAAQQAQQAPVGLQQPTSLFDLNSMAAAAGIGQLALQGTQFGSPGQLGLQGGGHLAGMGGLAIQGGPLAGPGQVALQGNQLLALSGLQLPGPGQLPLQAAQLGAPAGHMSLQGGQLMGQGQVALQGGLMNLLAMQGLQQLPQQQHLMVDGMPASAPAPIPIPMHAGQQLQRPQHVYKHVCHIEGCSADLAGLKDYHLRYRICDQHLKASSVMKDGIAQRFCQQCGRFHQLKEFDGIRRSCRAMLQRHNARRNKRVNPDGAQQPTSATGQSLPSPTQQ